jgi:4'-phosphopantetheinyl transferase EntD
MGLLLLESFIEMPETELGIHLGVTSVSRNNISTGPIPASLHKSSIKRRAEFLAGRKAAEIAIRRLDPNIDTYVGIGSDGLPLWPKSIVGSISHCDSWAVAAVASAKSTKGLGIDIELRSSAEIIKDMPEMILAASERTEHLSPTSMLARFSAKESVYKCLFPIFRQFIDFTECVILPQDENFFKIKLIKQFPGKPECKLEGLYTIKPDYVLALSWIT